MSCTADDFTQHLGLSLFTHAYDSLFFMHIKSTFWVCHQSSAEEVVAPQTHLQEVNSQGLLIFKDCENNSIAEGKCSIKEYYLLQLLFFNDCGNNQKYSWDEIPCSFCHLHKFTAILYMVETRLESRLEPSRLEPSSHARTKMEAVRWCIGKH